MQHSNPDNLLSPAIPEPGQNLNWERPHGAAFGLAVAEAARQHQGPVVVVIEDQRQLQVLESEIQFFLGSDKSGEIVVFPAWECLPYDNFSPHPDIVSERLRLLSALPKADRGIILVQTGNLMQRLCPSDYVLGHSFSIAESDTLDLEILRGNLVTGNYVAMNQVMAPGEFAIRGGVIDVFPMGSKQPFRLDLFDNEVESIRLFDPESQRTTERINRIDILPAREFPLTDAGVMQFRARFRQVFDVDPKSQVVYREVSEGRNCPGLEFYFPLFFDESTTLFSYLPENTLLITYQNILDGVRTYRAEIQDRFENANLDSTRRALPPDYLYIDSDELGQNLNQFTAIEVTEDGSRGQWESKSAANRQYPVDPKAEKPFGELAQHLISGSARKLLVAETPGRMESLETALIHNGLSVTTCDSFLEFAHSTSFQIGICIGELERGLNLPDRGIQVITESQLYGEKVYQRRRRSVVSRDPDAIIKSLAELNLDDPVVHIEHGVGRYRGLTTLDVLGEETEYLTLEYQNNDKLYIPILSLHLISRFVGGSPDLAPLHRLGGDQWQSAKKRAREKAYDVATELLEIEAIRNAREGTRFPLQEDEYQQFTSQFAFEETPDQLQAIQEVLSDLAATAPMDRLVCGDVGFGKTEVALRAAFTVTQNGQQVALLAPTTLLAQQHYETFAERFNDWPVNVAVLSRFNTPKQTRETLERLVTGNIDIVIGTHRLLQEDIRFSGLGLLIIDEEHRFGVRQKEKLKRLRSQVDILTLTATPIPRTLNITMSGLRAISIIATPPLNRISIKTFVRQWNKALVREACLREIRRGGQVFFLHNEVRTIESMAQELAELIPEAEVNIGHGQMPELRLERIMQDFYHQRFNVLVCSTIIESGIDIPSANTIIINRADKFGLAQLHQLRGRVGRSHHQAFAYLLIPDREQITSDARKRLEAIESMEDLGAGFALASHDLEIRGAGELLGETQSGLIDDVGFSLYSEYLSQAVRSIRQGHLPQTDPGESGSGLTTVDLHVPALFPESYLANAHTRLVLYKRIASAASTEELEELQIETIDRFGLLPEQGKNLFRLTAIRLQCDKLGVKKLDVSESGGTIEFRDSPAIDTMTILQLISDHPQKYQLGGPSVIKVIELNEDPVERLSAMEALVDELVSSLDDPA